MAHLTRRRLVKAILRAPKCNKCSKPVLTTRNGFPYCKPCKSYVKDSGPPPVNITDPAWWETSQQNPYKLVRPSDFSDIKPMFKPTKTTREYLESLIKKEFKDPDQVFVERLAKL